MADPAQVIVDTEGVVYSTCLHWEGDRGRPLGYLTATIQREVPIQGRPVRVHYGPVRLHFGFALGLMRSDVQDKELDLLGSSWKVLNLF